MTTLEQECRTGAALREAARIDREHVEQNLRLKQELDALRFELYSARVCLLALVLGIVVMRWDEIVRLFR